MDNTQTIVRSAAHFVVCKKCKGHGRIVFSDGSKSVEVCSVYAANAEIETALAKDLLAADEVTELRHQIRRAGLEYDITSGDVLVQSTELIRALGATIPKPKPKNFGTAKCEYLH